ncbi:MAG: HPr(Ser) kinase/phosphatase [Candidatus Latescibacterota bacterium]|nr:MAG: HPr(Ser) kinase/phosphatase [Candidatus Latescibacterota bacterium]
MQNKVLSVREFFDTNAKTLALEQLNEPLDGSLPITVPDIHRPGLALTGFMQNYLNERIQILGETEILYLNARTKSQRKRDIDNLFSVPLVCIIVTRDLEVPEELVKAANEHGIPLLGTSMLTTPFIHELTRYLSDYFAPTEVVHGTMVDVYGVGLLFTGKSGIGKSEIALDLIERGHRLVADDSVLVVRKAEDILIGRGHEHLQHFMEIRGIGIIDIQAKFGIRAIRVQKRLEVAVNLMEWDAKKHWEREGLEERHSTILGVKIPQVDVPLFPGKNITVIAEVIAMNHMFNVYGYKAADRFNQLLIDRMESDRRTRHYLRYDTE